MKKIVEIEVDGLINQNFASSIKKRLQRLDGVMGVSVYTAQRKVRVGFENSALSKEDIIRTVRKMGFAPKEQVPHPADTVVKNIVIDMDKSKDSDSNNRAKETLLNLDGVRDVSVFEETNSAYIEYDSKKVTAHDMIKALEKINIKAKMREQTKEDATIKKEVFRIFGLITAVVFGSLIVYISMSGQLVVNISVPSLLSSQQNPANFGLAQLVLILPVLISGIKLFGNGYRDLFRLCPKTDTLIAISVTYCLGVSVYHTIQIMTGYADAGKGLYYWYCALTIIFVLVGRFLEYRSKNKSSPQRLDLGAFLPSSARIVRDGQESELSSSQIQEEDMIIVRTNEKIPADARVIDGEALVHQELLTGEKMPVLKKRGDEIFAGCLCEKGEVLIRTTSAGNKTMISKIIENIKERDTSGKPAIRVIDKLSRVLLVCMLIGIVIISAAVFFLLDKSWGWGSYLDLISLIVILACPPVMGLAVPLVISAAIKKGADIGILFRKGIVLENMSKIKKMLFDKEGTLTSEEFEVVDLIALKQVEPQKIIYIAACAMSGIENKIYDAVIEFAKNNEIESTPPQAQNEFLGQGVKAQISGIRILAGSADFMSQNGVELKDCPPIPQGCVGIYVAVEKHLLGVLVVSQVINSEAKKAVILLKRWNIEPQIITGDCLWGSDYAVDKIGISTIQSNLLPLQKQEYVLSQKSKKEWVGMVGDGLCDVPALCAADVGINSSKSTDISANCSEVILMKDDLSTVVMGIGLARKAVNVIKQNLF
ncbi:MAG: heavy metal translocating P-type ATPase, partial [Oscillospiraceae bacterium]|nr:heavy metal translocating P-type ATPase [Oscillospiraceae bacterium]